MKITDLTSRLDIGLILNEMGLKGIGAEIGVEYGKNAELILATSELSELLLVDAWRYIDGHDPKGFGVGYDNWDEVYFDCIGRMAKFGNRSKMMRMTSSEAAAQVADGSLDFVYIDANHMSPYIDEDLSRWFAKVKPGGLIGGHDYYDRKIEGVFQCDVKSVIDKFFASEGTPVFITEDEVPSWYAIKGSV